VRGITVAALAFAGLLGTYGTAAVASAGPALGWDYPGVQLLCTAAANHGTLEGSVCVLPFGQTTAPNAYSATIAVNNQGRGATFAVVAGALPPGLIMSGATITGNPTKAGVFDFTIKATKGGQTATLAYEITITVQGPPDQLLCSPAVNGGFLEGSTCVLPDANVGVPYRGHLPTSHQAGGAVRVISGALPPGLSLPTTFGAPGDVVGGIPTDPGIEPARDFVVQGTGDQGQPLYQLYEINVDPNQPLAINASGGSTLTPGTVGQPYAQNFFVSGGAAPYTWSLAAGQLPPGLHLQTFSDPRDANDELAGTPTTAGTFTFTMKLADFDGQHATQQFTLTIQP
jgi:large repetitive protein